MAYTHGSAAQNALLPYNGMAEKPPEEQRTHPMKIAVMGYSGSGKSTLAEFLGRRHELDVLHLDSVQFVEGWRERDRDEAKALVGRFMESHDSWVIDGNYRQFCWKERLEQADRIVLMEFGRLSCFARVLKRTRTYYGRERPDLAPGCPERLDPEFLRWVVWDGRTRERRAAFAQVEHEHGEKVVHLRTQRQLNAFMAQE